MSSNVILTVDACPPFYHTVFQQNNITAWLTGVQPSDWLATVVLNSMDHVVENHVLKAIDNGLNGGLLVFDT